MRDGLITATPALVSLLLRAADTLGNLVAATKAGETDLPDVRDVVAEIQQHLGRTSPGPETQAPESPTSPEVRTFQVLFEPEASLFRRGTDPLLLLRDLAQLGEVLDVYAEVSRVPEFKDLDPDTCYLAWSLLLRTERPRADVEEVFSFVREESRVVIEELPAQPSTPQPSQVEVMALSQGPVGVSPGRKLDSSSIRVPIDKVDKLVNLVEELVIAQSMLNQTVGQFSVERLPMLQEAVATMERNLRELQERVMAVRMVPLNTISGRFPRLVREVAAGLGKKVNIDMVGQETELDKQVTERIGDPLIHLIRNAVDHGIEPVEDRLRQGKPPEGTIRLSGCHQGDNVIIDVTDDGRGLDTERIRRKAVSQGLVRAEDDLTEEEIHALIFHPGFSTAEAVSDISGRGVGMDVVKRNVEALNGSVSIASVAGQGSRFRIKLPLTLAILDGLCLSLGDEVFILPLLSVVESLQPGLGALKTVLGRGEVILVRGEALPLFRLHHLLGTAARETRPGQGLVVIVESDGKKFGLLVDDLLGQSQVVIKNLEVNYRKVEGIAGATILGDGRVALILDVHGLVRLADRQRLEVRQPPAEEDIVFASSA